MVALRGMKADEIIDFASLTYRKPCHIRFIELMPIGEKNAWTSERFISVREILDRVQSLGPLHLVNSGPLEGPANRYALKGAKGEIGLIGALSHHFYEN
ncbi:MAG: hypothetical protein JW902_10105 [Syntrophaceae bacterium]|nr:hypothetical protein [Syntrophaceae bacterium]